MKEEGAGYAVSFEESAQLSEVVEAFSLRLAGLALTVVGVEVVFALKKRCFSSVVAVEVAFALKTIDFPLIAWVAKLKIFLMVEGVEAGMVGVANFFALNARSIYWEESYLL